MPGLDWWCQKGCYAFYSQRSTQGPVNECSISCQGGSSRGSGRCVSLDERGTRTAEQSLNPKP